MPVLCGITPGGMMLQLPFDVTQQAAGSETKHFRPQPRRAKLLFDHRQPLDRLLRRADAARWLETHRHSGCCAYSRMARVITRPTGKVALVGSLPVEVLMKSAPAIMATTLARPTLRSVSRSPVPRITFMCADPQACLNAATSS